MKKIILSIAIVAIFSLSAMGQPAAVQKAAKAVFSLTTFKQDGTRLASSYGVFIGRDGTAIGFLEPFKGAARATVIDANGRQYEVDCLLGGNELYGVVKFRVRGSTPFAPVAAAGSARGSKAWLLPYTTQKPQPKGVSIARVEKFSNTYNYYAFSYDAPDNQLGCPFVNDKGEVIGLLQHSMTNNEVYAVDANFTKSLKVNGLSINDPALRMTEIRTALPDKEDDARLTLVLAREKGDSALIDAYAHDFIQQFPAASDGYQALAEQALAAGKYAEVDRWMADALKKVAKKDEAYSEYAKVINQKLIYDTLTAYPTWTFEKALAYADDAYKANPQPIYKQQHAQILYAKGDYQQAYDEFMKLTTADNLNKADIYYDAAMCRQQMNASDDELLGLMNKSIESCPKPISQVSANYFLTRGMIYDRMKNYRLAVNDYNTYDTLMYLRASHDFYYLRYKAEMKLHRWQQALNDIAHAIVINPAEPTYYAEYASLAIRVNRSDEAIKAAQRCTELAPEYADGYLLLGLAQVTGTDKSLKAAGIANLQKAKALGDTRAEGYIKKYK